MNLGGTQVLVRHVDNLLFLLFLPLNYTVFYDQNKNRPHRMMRPVCNR